MKHPDEQSWSDYVRDKADEKTRLALRTHLESGCCGCQAQVDSLQAVLRVARLDREFEVPATALRAAQNVFRVQNLLAQEAEAPRMTLSLAFDSLLAPATTGIRSATTQHRHLVYESSEMSLDLQFEPDYVAEGGQLLGQVLDSNQAPMADIAAFLLRDGRIESQASSGKMGEFQLRTAGSAARRLCLMIGGNQLVDLELPAFGEKAN